MNFLNLYYLERNKRFVVKKCINVAGHGGYPWRLWQEELKFEASLNYIASSSLAWTKLETLSQKKKKARKVFKSDTEYTTYICFYIF
jgi:hypothetical protein